MITGMCHHARLVFLVQTRFLYVGQAGLELPTSGDPPSLASQSAGITGVSHRAWPQIYVFLGTLGGLTITIIFTRNYVLIFKKFYEAFFSIKIVNR